MFMNERTLSEDEQNTIDREKRCEHIVSEGEGERMCMELCLTLIHQSPVKMTIDDNQPTTQVDENSDGESEREVKRKKRR